MSVRVLPYPKSWQKIEPTDLLAELDAWVPRLQDESKRIRRALAAGTWNIDTHNDPMLVLLGNQLWRFAERIRRGERVVYLSVVRDTKGPSGKRRIQTLKSFGRQTAASAAEAHNFMGVFEAAMRYRGRLGRRRLTTEEATAFRNTYGPVLGSRWVDVIVEGEPDMFDADPQSSIEAFADA